MPSSLGRGRINNNKTLHCMLPAKLLTCSCYRRKLELEKFAKKESSAEDSLEKLSGSVKQFQTTLHARIEGMHEAITNVDEVSIDCVIFKGHYGDDSDLSAWLPRTHSFAPHFD